MNSSPTDHTQRCPWCICFVRLAVLCCSKCYRCRTVMLQVIGLQLPLLRRVMAPSSTRGSPVGEPLGMRYFIHLSSNIRFGKTYAAVKCYPGGAPLGSLGLKTSQPWRNSEHVYYLSTTTTPPSPSYSVKKARTKSYSVHKPDAIYPLMPNCVGRTFPREVAFQNPLATTSYFVCLRHLSTFCRKSAWGFRGDVPTHSVEAGFWPLILNPPFKGGRYICADEVLKPSREGFSLLKRAGICLTYCRAALFSNRDAPRWVTATALGQVVSSLAFLFWKGNKWKGRNELAW